MSVRTFRCGHVPPERDEPYFAYVPPRILPAGLPESEQEIAKHIDSELVQLRWKTNHFADAVMLFEHTTEVLKTKGFENQIQDHTAWRSIAARDGAMTVFQFGKIRNGIAATVARAPTLLQYVQQNRINLSEMLMKQFFPHFIGPELGMDVHFFSQWDRSLASNSLWGDRYRYEYEGRFIDCRISRASYLRLCSVMAEIGAAFEPAAHYTKAAAERVEAQ